MFVDLLVAGLSGGQTPPAAHATKGENCIMMALWNPQFFAGIEHMRSQAAKYIDFIRECPVTDDSKPIRIPGDRANAARQASSSRGIDLRQELVDELKRIGRQLGVEWPSG
jgi:LDH2 family malate/lactate/ureidoglycolate dehydrogenase